MKASDRLKIYQSIVEAGPKDITEIRLLEGPWGGRDVTPQEYFRLMRDYAGHHTCRDNTVTARGKLDRALGTAGRMRWVVAQVGAQLRGAYHWDANLGLFYGAEPVVTWKHIRTDRKEALRETMIRALDTAST